MAYTEKERVYSSWIRGKSIASQVLEVGCECGEMDKRCLVFHHVDPATKRRDIPHMHSYSVESLVKEIEKCDVMCANCHMILHG